MNEAHFLGLLAGGGCCCPREAMVAGHFQNLSNTGGRVPIIHINLIAGRDESAVQHCAREVARTVHRTLGAPLVTIRVLVHQLPPSQWIVGDMTRAELDAQRMAGAGVPAHRLMRGAGIVDCKLGAA